METTTCPVCGATGCRVKEAFTQATRWEPMLSLGLQGLCIPCQLYFKVERTAALQIAMGEES